MVPLTFFVRDYERLVAPFQLAGDEKENNGDGWYAENHGYGVTRGGPS
jgi:hypothetical protein